MRAHVFLCALAAYLTWPAAALAPLTFTDEQPPEHADPVAPARRSPPLPAAPGPPLPARRSPPAQRKAATKTTADGTEARAFRDLLDHLGTHTRDTIAVTVADHTTRFEQLTVPTRTQQKASARL